MKYGHGVKSMKMPFVINADMESLLQKIDTCHNNLEKLSTTKIKKDTSSGYSFFTNYSFHVSKNRHNYYRGKDCLNNFCKILNYALKIIDCEKNVKKKETRHLS